MRIVKIDFDYLKNYPNIFVALYKCFEEKPFVLYGVQNGDKLDLISRSENTVFYIENDGVIVNIPKSCVNIAIDYVYISSNINDLISRKTPYTAINLRSGSFKLDNGTIIRPSRHSDCSNMVVI